MTVFPRGGFLAYTLAALRAVGIPIDVDLDDDLWMSVIKLTGRPASYG